MIFKSHRQREKCIDQACGEEKLLSLLSADTSIDLRNNFNCINQIYNITKKNTIYNSYTKYRCSLKSSSYFILFTNLIAKEIHFKIKINVLVRFFFNKKRVKSILLTRYLLDYTLST